MNNIEALARESVTVQQFAAGYLNYLSTLFQKMDMQALASVVAELESARKAQNTVFVCGNGGSAATASHMANDFGVDVYKKGGSGNPYRILSLTDNPAVMLAIANDDGYHNLFINQLKIHYRDGDKLIAISASGNSPNVIEASRWVKEKGGVVMGLTGFDGGELAKLADININISTPKGEYGPVEDLHMILDHLIANWLQYQDLFEFNPENR
nr:SIS domain-containing protein [uncultured Desulfobacter sp.]